MSRLCCIETVPIRTVNRQCSSGLQAVADVASAIRAGFYDIGKSTPQKNRDIIRFAGWSYLFSTAHPSPGFLMFLFLFSWCNILNFLFIFGMRIKIYLY